MRGRHRPPRRKAEWRKRAEILAADLDRSEESRIQLLAARDHLLNEVRDLAGKLYRLQVELGSEASTLPVPVPVLRAPEAGFVPLQRPDGIRVAVQVGQSGEQRSPGRSGARRPTWATG